MDEITISELNFPFRLKKRMESEYRFKKETCESLVFNADERNIYFQSGHLPRRSLVLII